MVLQLSLGVIVSIIVALQVFTSTAMAYNRNNATSYADLWALARNSNYPTWGSDCTNFASQALVAGSYPQVRGDSNVTNNNNWFFWWNIRPWTWTNSRSWSVAVDQYKFQMWHYPGGWLWSGPLTPVDNNFWYAYNAIYNGDQLYYNWNGDKNTDHINHMGVQVNPGYSNYYNCNHTCNYGDLVDYHTTDRYHAIWNLVDINPNWSTEVIWQVHIDDRN